MRLKAESPKRERSTSTNLDTFTPWPESGGRGASSTHMKSGGTLTAAGNNRIHREHFDIYLLVLSTEKGFEVGSKRVARSRQSKRFERRITKGTKYFDEVWKFLMNELLWAAE